MINFITFSIGYIFGKLTNNTIIGVSNTSQKPIGFFDKSQKENKTKISIDDSKFIADITTDNLEKKYTSLGDTKTSTENISSSISKLKNMKG